MPGGGAPLDDGDTAPCMLAHGAGVLQKGCEPYAVEILNETRRRLYEILATEG